MLKKIMLRATYSLATLMAIGALAGMILLLQSKAIIFKQASDEYMVAEEATEAFPVSVNVHTEEISSSAEIDDYFADTFAAAPEEKNNWWNQIAAVFATKDWYQNLASSVSRIVVIWPGERKEEVVKNISDVLRWNQADRDEFLALMETTTYNLNDGQLFPDQYVTHRYATPAEMKQVIEERFTSEIGSRYTEDVSAQVPFKDAMIVASLLEREASDFDNMREVSGVIWNRLFIDMPLQLDATLQYVKGSYPTVASWWPAVRPADKYLDSSFNTYQNSGLPPEPIANVSVEAVLAALNPIQTDCLYYFHARNADYYCSETYDEHVKKLKQVYGRGS